jgi:hypothetical protein
MALQHPNLDDKPEQAKLEQLIEQAQVSQAGESELVPPLQHEDCSSAPD